MNIKQDDVSHLRHKRDVVESKEVAVEKQEAVVNKAPLEEKPAELKRVDKLQVAIVVLLVADITLTIFS